MHDAILREIRTKKDIYQASPYDMMAVYIDRIKQACDYKTFYNKLLEVVVIDATLKKSVRNS